MAALAPSEGIDRLSLWKRWFAFLGVAIDIHRNDTVHDDGDITADGATVPTVRTVVITAREDLQIAREARRLLGTR